MYKGIDLGDQLDTYFGTHRSGWSYAVKSFEQFHREGGIYLETFIERPFVWHFNGIRSIERPWIGFFHTPPFIPYQFPNRGVLATEVCQKSLPYCKGMFTLSEYHKRHLEGILDVPVNALVHPTETVELKWTYERFRQNDNKSLYHIGWWLRKYSAIFETQVKSYQKVMIKPVIDISTIMGYEIDERKREGHFKEWMNDTVRVDEQISNEEYDRVLSENVVFVSLYDCSACNLIIECIVRHTPILVNRLPATEEYLGEDYPFFYESYEEAAHKADDFEQVRRAHEYLKSMPKERFTLEYFAESFRNSPIIRENVEL
jgi:hypothetical protein